MKPLTCVSLFFLMLGVLMMTDLLNAQTPSQTVNVWPGVAPGQVTDKAEEHVPGKDGTTRYHNVSVPTITIYPAAGTPLADVNKYPPAVLISPGGGFGLLAYDKEGTEIAQWLSSIGVTGIVLKYRVPGNRDGAFADAQRAMGLIRLHAEQWQVDANRLGVMGFSAGGELSARLSTNYAKRSYERVDEADDLSCRPDFTMLVYPGGLNATDAIQLRDSYPVDDKTPPAIMVQTQDDALTVKHCLAYYQALLQHKVKAELHLFPDGGHGYGMRPGKERVRSEWPRLFEFWLRDNFMR